ncbi:hypothetical protein KCMC57_up37750 [Kitasatospora sp. CMC57]|uniref:Chaplin domain-containing protein n=1 Tax=Kitasatospora sp. CMC57 TaxID=3231513 RepID=A0AB33JWW5_9ACTN
MNRTKKFAATVGLGLALALSSAAPALAECGEQEAVQQHENYVPHHGVEHGNGTTCINTGGASASAVVVGSPGVLSGNNIQIPISIPINICGNSIG